MNTMKSEKCVKKLKSNANLGEKKKNIIACDLINRFLVSFTHTQKKADNSICMSLYCV